MIPVVAFLGLAALLVSVWMLIDTAVARAWTPFAMFLTAVVVASLLIGAALREVTT